MRAAFWKLRPRPPDEHVDQSRAALLAFRILLVIPVASLFITAVAFVAAVMFPAFYVSAVNLSALGHGGQNDLSAVPGRALFTRAKRRANF